MRPCQHVVVGWPCLSEPSANGWARSSEEQLFRFGRAGRASLLTALLSDFHPPAGGPPKSAGTTGPGGSINDNAAARCWRNTVTLLRRERADEAVIDLAELAVVGARWWHVTAAADLVANSSAPGSPRSQPHHGHPVSVQLNVDPAVLGGWHLCR